MNLYLGLIVLLSVSAICQAADPTCIDGAIPATIRKPYYNVTLASGFYSMLGCSRPSITVLANYTFSFNVNTPGRPFWLKTAPTSGTGNGIPGVINNGASSGEIRWTPSETDVGTKFYYVDETDACRSGVVNVAKLENPVTPAVNAAWALFLFAGCPGNPTVSNSGTRFCNILTGDDLIQCDTTVPVAWYCDDCLGALTNCYRRPVQEWPAFGGCRSSAQGSARFTCQGLNPPTTPVATPSPAVCAPSPSPTPTQAPTSTPTLTPTPTPNPTSTPTSTPTPAPTPASTPTAPAASTGSSPSPPPVTTTPTPPPPPPSSGALSYGLAVLVALAAAACLA